MAKWRKHPYGMLPTQIAYRHREFDRGANEEGEPHSPTQLEALRRSIEKDGMRRPLEIIYNPYTQDALLIQGNHRVQIAKALGIKNVPATVYLTDEAITADPHGRPVRKVKGSRLTVKTQKQATALKEKLFAVRPEVVFPKG